MKATPVAIAPACRDACVKRHFESHSNHQSSVSPHTAMPAGEKQVDSWRGRSIEKIRWKHRKEEGVVRVAFLRIWHLCLFIDVSV